MRDLSFTGPKGDDLQHSTQVDDLVAERLGAAGREAQDAAGAVRGDAVGQQLERSAFL
jgi:hypothetical protein